MMKGVELASRTIVVIVVLLIVMVAVLYFFYKGAGGTMSGIIDESDKNRECTEWSLYGYDNKEFFKKEDNAYKYLFLIQKYGSAVKARYYCKHMSDDLRDLKLKECPTRCDTTGIPSDVLTEFSECCCTLYDCNNYNPGVTDCGLGKKGICT
jgi:hypothetical protein